MKPSEKFDPLAYPSGGGWGGAEDPRLTRVGKTVHMLYVALDTGIPQLNITSIPKADFSARRWWRWRKPRNISPPGVIVKSGCLFPEKIRGRYVVLYRIFPDIWMDFVDDLRFEAAGCLKGKPVIRVRKGHWDSRKIGAGAPPIKTREGWLLIYYGVDDRDASRYKIGAMLLDREDPTRVLYRSRQPILEPDRWYENEGHKAGIAYPCGAVMKDGNLLVYYGGADSYLCAASAPWKEFLGAMKREIRPSFRQAALRPRG